MKTITFTISAVVLAALSLWPAAVQATTGHAGRSGETAATGPDGPTPGQIQHWGAYFGDGIGSDANRHLWPTGVSFPDSAPVVQVASSNAAQYALLGDGTVWAWGQGTDGELGDGSDADSFTTPVQVQFPSGVQIAFLATDAMPYDTALAVDTDGNAWGWGLNEHGELCLGDTTAYNAPVQLPLTEVTALAGASGHAVYDSAGTVYSCGSDGNGVLGDNQKKNTATPMAVVGLTGQDVVALVSSYANAGALLANGQYYDWGYNAAGQLGSGTMGAGSRVPVQVTLPDPSPVTQVAEGGSTAKNGQTLVMLADGSVYAWGNDAYSQLGDGGTANQPSPEQIFAPAGVAYQVLATGGATSYAITAAGVVYAWGQGKEGQLGNGTRDPAPAPVEVPTSDASLISATANDVAVN